MRRATFIKYYALYIYCLEHNRNKRFERMVDKLRRKLRRDFGLFGSTKKSFSPTLTDLLRFKDKYVELLKNHPENEQRGAK